MGCYENREMKRLRTGFFLMAAVVFSGGILLLLAEWSAQEARFVEGIREFYGAVQAEALLAFVGRRDYRSVWMFAGLSAASFGAYFFYMTRCLSDICGEIRRFSLGLEQMTAGKIVSLAEWKEGILAALSNQAELLYLRNRHMVELVQEEKENICQFTENMVHQMKTPLTAMRLDLDLMEIKLSGWQAPQTLQQTQIPQMPQQAQIQQAPQEKQKAFLRKVEDCSFQCDRLRESVDEFLSASRLAAGQMKLILKPAGVEDIVAGTCVTLAPVLEKRKIRVHVSSESELPLYCDCNWMEAALANILKNSAEAMETGGIIEVRHWDEKNWKYLEILDESGGVSEEMERHMFERFYTGRQKKGGTGLGLAIAREVVEACHGTIAASSVAGREGKKDGTRFLMKFRILDGPEAYGA